MRLENKVAIVVGAGQHARRKNLGNGRATAIIFAREGAKVLCADIDEGSANDTVRIIEENGGVAFAQKCDINNEPECERLVNACVERYGRVDILHNNVGGTYGMDHTVEELDLAGWHQIVDLNLTSMALTCKYALPVMRAQRSGSIINVSSAASLRAMPILAYSCAKAGVNALTQHVAGLGANDGVRCNALVLGKVDDESTRGTRWDVGYAATFLASDESRFITGVLLPIDGGHSARLEELCSTGSLPRDF